MRPSLQRTLHTSWRLALFLTLAGCPKRPPDVASPPAPPPAAAPSPLERAHEIARWVDARLDRQNTQLWRAWTEGAPLDADALTRPEPRSWTDAIATVAEARRAAHDESTQRALEALHVHLVGEYLAESLASLDEAIAGLEGSLEIDFEDRRIPWRSVERELAAEVNTARRRKLYESAAMTGARLSPLLRRRAQQVESLLRAIGYPKSGATLAYAAQLQQADLARLGALAEELLAVTHGPYLTVMDRLARRELGMAFEKTTRADIPRLFRKSQVDEAFPAHEAIPRLNRTLEGLGLALGDLAHLELDARDLPQKSPRPLSLLIDQKVHLSLEPAEGVRASAAMFREAGHALALTPIAARRDPYARLQGAATAQAFGALFADLMEDPLWLEQFAGLVGKRRTDYLAGANAHRLYLLRHRASRLLYQLALYREGIPVGTNEARQVLKTLMQRADQLAVSDVDVLWAEWSLGELLVEANSLRAAFLGAQLQRGLEALGGRAWWSNRAAGARLTGWLQESVGKRPGELARLVGARGVQVDALLLRMGAALEVPIPLPRAKDEEGLQ